MNQYTKREALMLKGIAIVLMLTHHVLAFPKRINESLYPISFTKFLDMDTGLYIAKFGAICVAFFMFLGGYATYVSYKRGKLSILDKIFGLYLKYWKVFIIFVPIGFLYFGKQMQYCKERLIPFVFAKFDLIELVKNFTGVEGTYNKEWWFLFSYVIALLTFPLVIRMIEKNSVWKNFWLLIIYGITVQFILPDLYTIKGLEGLKSSTLYNMFFLQKAPHITSFWMGCIVAKDGVFERCMRKYHDRNKVGILADLLIIFIISIFENKIMGAELDFIYVPILSIALLDLIKRSKVLEICTVGLGKQSTNMWLTHSFLCYYFYACTKIILLPKYAILVVPWFIIITYILSALIDGFYSLLGVGYSYIGSLEQRMVEKKNSQVRYLNRE